MSPVHRMAAVVITTVATLALTMTPGLAQQRVIRDHDGDGTTNITRVRVTHAPLWVYVKTFGAPSDGIPHFLDLWIDTDPGDPGPEFLVSQWPSEDERLVSVSAVERFRQYDGRQRCRFKTGGYSIAHQTDWLSFRRYCLRDAHGNAPERFRVSLQASDEVGADEWLPGQRRWSRWIHRG